MKMGKILDFIKTPLGIALVGALIPGAFSGGAAYYAYTASVIVQDRQRFIDELRKLDDANAKLVEAGAVFIAAINSGTGLDAARDKIRITVAQQIITSAEVKRILSKNDEKFSTDYNSALADLNRVTQTTASVTDMRPWVEAFGRAIDAKSNLSQAIGGKVGKGA